MLLFLPAFWPVQTSGRGTMCLNAAVTRIPVCPHSLALVGLGLCERDGSLWGPDKMGFLEKKDLTSRSRNCSLLPSYCIYWGVMQRYLF